MSNKDEAKIIGVIRYRVEVERPLTRAGMNVRRVVGITVIAAVIGAIFGLTMPLDLSEQPSNKVETEQ